jgi:hypothetical protein
VAADAGMVSQCFPVASGPARLHSALGHTYCMKMLLTSVVSLILGLGLGWYFERHRAEREKTEIVQQMMEGGEGSDRERAIRAARAIQLIGAGQPQQAVQVLAFPVAHYYTLYTGAGTKEERRAETRALIEQLAKSNQIVAARIAEFSTNSEPKTP